MASASQFQPAATAMRLPPLAGRYASGPGVAITPIEPRIRISLCADAGGQAAIGEAVDIALPRRLKSSHRSGGVSALWLGPDEWLLIGEGTDDRLRSVLSLGSAEISAVDVSHRNVGIAVEGPAAEAVIAAGCPQDLRPRRFPEGAASRTLLGKAEIVLWRRAPLRFEVECWRSFGDYVWAYLAEAALCPAP